MSEMQTTGGTLGTQGVRGLPYKNEQNDIHVMFMNFELDCHTSTKIGNLLEIPRFIAATQKKGQFNEIHLKK